MRNFNRTGVSRDGAGFFFKRRGGGGGGGQGASKRPGVGERRGT